MRAARLMSGGPAPASAPWVMLVAHGSADPRGARTIEAIAAAVARARPGSVVQPAYLDHTEPRPDQALARLAADRAPAVAVVPLLLTAAYHRRVDLPAVLAAARAAGAPPVRVTEVLGPVAGVVPPMLLAGLRRRLRAAGGNGAVAPPYDAVVLAAAGTRDRAARATVDEAAAGLGAVLGVPCLAAYASAAAPTPGEAVAALREGGARRVAMAAYFLAPGRLYTAAVEGALAAGAVAAAAPLAAAPELAALISSRLDDRVGTADAQRRELLLTGSG